MKKILISILMITAGNATQVVAQIMANITATNESCAGGMNNANGSVGTITVSNIRGGTPPYTVTATGAVAVGGQVQKGAAAQTSFTFSINFGPQTLASQVFNITVTDSATPPSTFTGTATLTQNLSLQLFNSIVTNVSCPGGSNGAIKIVPPATAAAASFSITNVATGVKTTQPAPNLAFKNLPAGLYITQVTDTSGNCAFNLARVTEPATATNPLVAFLQAKYCSSCIQVPTTATT